MKKELPEWVKKHKTSGTQIIQIGNNYYLYKIKSIWDRKKGRARKVTEKYLGKITPQGIIKSKYERLKEGLTDITVKEFGATDFCFSITSDIYELLKRYFPVYYKELYVFSMLRFFHCSTIKNVGHYYITSDLSDRIRDCKLSPKSISGMLKYIGMKRKTMVDFLKNFLKGRKFQVIDLTHVFSYSEDIISSTLGHNSEGQYIPQINLVMVFSLKERHPGFFRIVPGSIRDIKVLHKTIQEAEIKEAVIIADKGFYSNSNVEFLQEHGLQYIIPLKRNTLLIDYSCIESADRRGFDGFFIFEKRLIWHKEKVEKGRRVILFFDEKLKAEEEKDIVGHIDGGSFSIERFYEIQYRLGSISVITNTDLNAKEVYELLKGRVEIEQSFDTLKNLLHADRVYLRDDFMLQGWMFVNFLSLLHYYRVYMKLREAELLKKYSVKDLIIHLRRIYKLKIDNKWVTSEIPKTSRKILEKLNFNLHIT